MDNLGTRVVEVCFFVFVLHCGFKMWCQLCCCRSIDLFWFLFIGSFNVLLKTISMFYFRYISTLLTLFVLKLQQRK